MTSRSSPGAFSPRSRPLAIHSPCGMPARLEADGWGFCKACRVEWEASEAEIAAGGSRP